MSQNLSSAAVVIGALRVNIRVRFYLHNATRFIQIHVFSTKFAWGGVLYTLLSLLGLLSGYTVIKLVHLSVHFLMCPF